MIRTAFALLLLATPAMAEPWDCTFTTTCLASLDCFDQDNSARVIAADHAGDLFLEWDGMQLRAEALSDGAGYVAVSPRDTHALLTITGNLAILTTHTAAAMTFFGSCEVLGN
ncbi:hypothetical protein [Gymnodinialimonas hymeniacidonis]|uniref:hypothetical protein n=1 Tax=Gymnodinialimonas hymeniacidonis TaxID=3126508 RepID=UPI0034C6B829